MKRGFKKWAEETSSHYRTNLKLSNFSPLPAEVLAKHLGVVVKTPKQIRGITSDLLNILEGINRYTWSAITLYINNSYIIIHNDLHSKFRQTSNIMHELSHIICKHEMNGFKEIGGFPFRIYNKEKEDEAEWLSGCLMLPRKALQWAIRKGLDENMISNIYSSSPDMVKYRINKTGINKQYSHFSKSI